MNVNEIIKTKRDMKELSKEQIDYFISEYSKGNIPDYQASSLLMAIYLNGMKEREILDLTLAMAHSGDFLDLSEIKGIKVDKHSTGGIGDKVTMVVMPLVASCGVPVAKMSGRGLGYTQGTIDKLNAIPGFKTDLSMEQFINNVKSIGIALMSQTENIALADKKLYALRDVTGTVESIPLIASSVMSKKLASGADKILLEVTCGSGAFMDSPMRAQMLAETMVKIGNMAGKETVAVLTNMNQPLGRFCGNALEAKEAIDILSGKGEKDVNMVCGVLGAHMLKLAGVGNDIVENMKLIQSKIDNREGLQKFKEMIGYQGGSIGVIDNPDSLMTAKFQIPINSVEDGFVESIEAKNIGQAVVNLGGGRLKKDDPVDLAVGIEVLKKIGDEVKQGEPIMIIHANDENKAYSQITFLRESYTFTKEKVEKPKEILGVIDGEN